MNLCSVEEKYHFVGLGGIGMSALARILLQKGAEVQGSDLQQSPLLEQLAQEGAVVHIGHKAEHCESASVAVYSSDVKMDNVELQKAKERNIAILHRSDLLHALMQGKKPLLVTGTHGKTTVTSLLASVLDAAGFSPSFVIGGIHRGWNTNGKWQRGLFFVAEADESDHSFIKTPAFGAIVTNLENDHLNYWKDPKNLEAAFAQFFSQAAAPEHLFWCGDDVRLRALHPRGVSYGFEPSNELRIEGYETTDTGVRFSLVWGCRTYADIDLQLLGKHNALNAAAVFGLALSLGAAEEHIRKALASFAGTSRRLEWKGRAQGVDLYDDYGHHPTEIAVTLKALREKIREKRLVVVFQPHRFTRLRDLFEEFLTCFNEADALFVTDIYGAGETPIPGLTAQDLVARLRLTFGDRVQYVRRTELETVVGHFLRPYDVAITLGAGDVTRTGAGILRQVEQIGFKWKVGVLYGGTSSEHAVSLMSARTIAEGLNTALLNVRSFGLTKNGQWKISPETLDDAPGPLLSTEVLEELTQCDVVIPVFHGQQGEDGMIQGLLDTLGLPYVGCDYRSSALCMHKGWSKHIARSIGVPTAAYVELDAVCYFKDPVGSLQKIEEGLPYPMWVKAVHLGSSLGVFRVAEPKDLASAVAAVFALDNALIAEKEMVGREVEFSLLGNEYIRVAQPGEIIKPVAFHQFDHKYGANASPIEVPAKLTETQRQIGESYAREMYLRAGCKGLARIDFFVDSQGHFWFNEINPFPGFTATSAYPLMWEATGLSVTELCDELLMLAFHKDRRLRMIRGR